MSNKEIVEINGVKFEVDLSHAKKIQAFKVGDPIKVLVKEYTEYKAHVGTVIGFDWFQNLPTVRIAYLKVGYPEADIKFIDYNREASDVEISPLFNTGELSYSKETIIELMDSKIRSKIAELDELKQKAELFNRTFGKFSTFLKPPQCAISKENNMPLTSETRNVCASDHYESLRLEQEAHSEKLHKEALEQLESFLLLEYADSDCLDFIEDEPDCHLFFSLSECQEIFSDLVARRNHKGIVNQIIMGSSNFGLSLLEQRFVDYLKSYIEKDLFLSTQDCKDVLSEMATKYDIEAIYEFLIEGHRSSKLSALDFLFLGHLDNCDFFSDYRAFLREQV